MSRARWRVALGVLGVWVLVALVSGVQSALGESLRGNDASLGGALRVSFIQTLPWIPVSLAVIALTVRYPMSRAGWRRHLPIHLVAALIVAFGANVLVVLGFWLLQGQLQSVDALLRSALLWTTVRLHIALLIYAAIAALTQGVLYWRETRDRELRLAQLETQLANARLQTLNAQVRPHFLFNTLHTIGQLWRSGRSVDADAVLDRLASVMHQVRATGSSTEVPLAEELELVRDYLAIEETRFPDRLTAVVDASPDALECLVPPLILQPLVENAVRHGIAAVSTAGRIEVRAVRDDGRLRLTVRDDGPGMAAPSPAPGSGTGLRTTAERLAQQYGERARLAVDSAPGEGTTVRIDLPVRE